MPMDPAGLEEHIHPIPPGVTVYCRASVKIP
jgi:hypothetical protein